MSLATCAPFLSSPLTSPRELHHAAQLCARVGLPSASSMSRPPYSSRSGAGLPTASSGSNSSSYYDHHHASSGSSSSVLVDKVASASTALDRVLGVLNDFEVSIYLFFPLSFQSIRRLALLARDLRAACPVSSCQDYLCQCYCWPVAAAGPESGEAATQGASPWRRLGTKTTAARTLLAERTGSLQVASGDIALVEAVTDEAKTLRCVSWPQTFSLRQSVATDDVHRLAQIHEGELK